MIEITSHKVNGLNEALKILATGEPGLGGGFERYEIKFQSPHLAYAGEQEQTTVISFQSGPIGEVGVNGISNEALLAIVEHRLQCYQAGQYSCRENAVALTKLQEAMMWLQKRTRDRMARGVEGTSAK